MTKNINKRKNNKIRIISIITSILLLLSVQGFAFAITTENHPNNDTATEKTPVISRTAGDLSLAELANKVLQANEVPEAVSFADAKEKGNVVRLREQEQDLYSVIFQNKDGSKTLYSFDYPVKYVDKDGKVLDKSTAITQNSEQSEYSFSSTNNDVQVDYPKDISTSSSIALKHKDIKVNMSPKSVMNANKIKSDAISASASNKLVPDESGKQKDTINYQGVFGTKTELRYQSTFEGFKEDIVLYENTGVNTFQFNIKTNGLKLTKTDSGAVYLTDPLTDVRKVRVGAIQVKGSAPNEIFEEKSQYNHHYEIEEVKQNEEYILTTVIDEKYLNNPETVYPVIIDPSFLIQYNNIEDATLYSGAPTYAAGAETALYAGNDSNGGYGTERFIIRAPQLVNQLLAAGIDYNMINQAKLQLYNIANGASSSIIRAYKLYNTWAENYVTCNNYNWNYYDGTQQDYTTVSNSSTFYYWDITRATKDWMSGRTNAGLILKADDETTLNKEHKFYASDSNNSYRPYMEIIYNGNYPTEGITDGGIYYLRNVGSGKYMDVNGQYTSDGSNVHQWDFHGGPSQQWKTTYLNNGTYKFTPMHATNKALDVSAASSANEANIQIWQDNGSNAQQWKIIANGNYSFRIMSSCSNFTKGAVVQNAGLNNGANIFQYSYNALENDQWVFESVYYGNAPSYSSIATTTTDINCAGFALRINKYINGSLLGAQNWDTVETIASKTMTYFQNDQPGRTIRRIPGVNLTPTYSIYNNEYRVAVRVVKSGTDSNYDYHFMIQTSDGKWAHKPGNLPSEPKGFINPSTYDWSYNYGGTTGWRYYNSDVIYFAVSR